MPQTPDAATKAVADSKKLMESWKQGPLGTKSGHLGEQPKQHEFSKASYQAPRKQRLDESSTAKEPIGETSAGEINRTLNEKEEAGKQLDQMNIPH